MNENELKRFINKSVGIQHKTKLQGKTVTKYYQYQ